MDWSMAKEEVATFTPDTVEQRLLKDLARAETELARSVRGGEYMRKRINDLENDIARRDAFALFTKVEAVAFLRDGSLPNDFAGRVQNVVEFYHCTNCDDRRCMGCVTRDWDHECADDCPFCCKDGECV